LPATWTTQITLNRLVKFVSARTVFNGVLDGRLRDRTAQTLADLPVGRAKESKADAFDGKTGRRRFRH
jgi:hypothetical protein